MEEKETFVDPEDKRALETAKDLNERFAPEQEKRPVGRPRKIISDEREKQMWMEAAVAFLTTLEIKHPNQLGKVFDYADEFVKQARDRIASASAG